MANETIPQVHFYTLLTCSKQINLLKETIENETDAELTELSAADCELIDNYEDDAPGFPEDKIEYTQTLTIDNIWEIFNNITPVIHKLRDAAKTNQRSRDDRLNGLIIQLVNISIYMPAEFQNEMFTVLLKLIEETVSTESTNFTNKAALKFCDLIFRHYYHDPNSSKVLLKVFQMYLKVAGQCNAIHEGPHTCEDIEKLIARWDLKNTEEEARIWQTLFKELSSMSGKGAGVAFKKQNIVELSSKVMLKMLDASRRCLDVTQQEALAKSCIINSLKDKKVYLYDSLLNSPAMQVIKHTPDYEILKIFTSGMLDDYRKFVKTASGKSFLADLQRNSKGQDPAPFLEQKIRQLTFIELAGRCLKQKNSFLKLSDLKNQLDLKDDIAVEEFIIDAIRTTMVKAKLSQSESKVMIHHAVPRQFTKQHWLELASRLQRWEEDISKVNSEFKHIINEVAPTVFKSTFAH